MRIRIHLLAAGVVLVAASAARADVVPFSQTREVSSFASISPANGENGLFDSDQTTSPDPGPFDDTSQSHVEDQGTYANAFAIQSSNIGPDLIEATGSFHAEAELDENRTFAEALGSCKLDYQFDVEGSASYTVAGHLEAAGNGSAYVSLIRNGGPILIYEYAQSGEMPIFVQGILDPGHYDFGVWTSGYGQALSPEESNPASGSFQMSLTFAESAGAPAASVPLALQLWPNPVRSGGVLHFTRPALADGRLSILDVTGRIVRRISFTGASEAVWDLNDNRGAPVAPGVYFIRSGDAHAGRKAVVLK